VITNVEILVSHGRAAALTRCRPDADWRPQRLERVVLRSPRGLELGDVLGAADAACDTSALAAGELIRIATAGDESLARELHNRSLALVDDAQNQIDAFGLPLLALDAEFLLDGREAYLHVLRWGDATLTPLVEHLSSRHDAMVRIVDRSQADHHDHEHSCSSCGSGGCGSCGDGGCGEKGCGKETCSSGSFKSANDLSAYFLKLREEMLSHPRVPLL
jgi:hypothetical protein